MKYQLENHYCDFTDSQLEIHIKDGKVTVRCLSCGKKIPTKGVNR